MKKIIEVETGAGPDAGTPEVRDLKLSELHPSPTNPRKVFDVVELNGLADSLGSLGQAQAILVRPVAKGYEIVAGERRFRAAKLVKLPTLRAEVRALTDAQVVELQAIENLQRVDLSPLEEAACYRAMLDLKDAKGKGAYTFETLAAKTGKSRSQIGERLRLLRLTTPVREALEGNQIEVGVAVQIGKVPADKQRELLAWALKPESWSSRKATHREVADKVAKEYVRDVRAAEFKPNVPLGDKSPGPCAECPRFGKNLKAEQPDISPTACLDVPCFERKTRTHRDLEFAKASKGRTVVSGEEYRQSHLIETSQACWSDGQRRTYGELMEKLPVKQRPEVSLMQGPDGKAVELVEGPALEEALEKAKILHKPKKVERPPEKPEDNYYVRQKMERKIQAAILARLGAMGEGELLSLLVVVLALGYSDNCGFDVESLAELGLKGVEDGQEANARVDLVRQLKALPQDLGALRERVMKLAFMDANGGGWNGWSKPGQLWYEAVRVVPVDVDEERFLKEAIAEVAQQGEE